jgi:hypothetical protein
VIAECTIRVVDADGGLEALAEGSAGAMQATLHGVDGDAEDLRDLGRVYEGVCQAVTDTVATGADLVRLWRHECLRIFSDRLVTPIDATIVGGALADIIETRSAQANLQLVVITPDEEFVSELGRATLGGGGPSSRNFAKYFRVYREEAPGRPGVWYSKIEASEYDFSEEA